MSTNGSSNTMDTITLPFSAAKLVCERDPSGDLIKATSNGRVYFEKRGKEHIYDNGFVSFHEIAAGNRLLRNVSVAEKSWMEDYRWDKFKRPVFVDGMVIERDQNGRITECKSEGETWKYHYHNHFLTRVDGPFGCRRITRDVEGRPTKLQETHFSTSILYNDYGRRKNIKPLGKNWHQDEFGRVWQVTNARGEVQYTFLWDGFACIGRIDGPLGDPIALVFSLDPSRTPVRAIGREKVVCFPRDAFGENLASHPVMPGLYGGANQNGYFYLKSRTLDPRTGSFDRADPWDGSEHDPRSKIGMPSFLPVEKAAGGVYVVCRNDPISRTDPTGEMSFLVTVLDLTWGIQNNLVSWFFLDWWFNLIVSLFKRLGDKDALNEFFSSEFITAKHSGIWGRRRDGVLSPPGQVWTMGHLVWSEAKEFSELAVAHAFCPKEVNPETITKFDLYGSLLFLEPKKVHKGKSLSDDDKEKSAPILLRGSGREALGIPIKSRGWSRSGGKALPVYPGALTPWFPAGGFHFDRVGGSLSDDHGRHEGPFQFDGNGATQTLGATKTSLKEGEYTGTVTQGDVFKVEGDPQTYAVTNRVLASIVNPAKPEIREMLDIKYSPPAQVAWKDGAEVHFKNYFTIPAPQDCTLTEFKSHEPPLPGKIERQVRLVAKGINLGVAANAHLALTDSAGVIHIGQVAEVNEINKKTQLRLTGDDLFRVAEGKMHVQSLQVPSAAPALLRGVKADHLVPTAPPPGAPGPYLPNDIIQFEYPGNNKQTVKIKELLIELKMNSGITKKLRKNATVDLYEPTAGDTGKDAEATADDDILDFDTAAGILLQPPKGHILELRFGGNSMIARVKDHLDDHKLKLDRVITPLAASAGDLINFRGLNKVRELGSKVNADTSGDTITCRPSQWNNTPASGFIVINSGTTKFLRTIQTKNLDALVIKPKAKAANGDNLINVQRYPEQRAQKITGKNREAKSIWRMNFTGGAAAHADTKGLTIMGFNTAPPFANVGGFNLPLTFSAGKLGEKTPVGFVSASPTVSQLVEITDSGGATQPGRIQHIQLDITLDRTLPAGAGANGLELVLLENSGPSYEAIAIGALQATVKPEVIVGAGAGAVTEQVEMPRFKQNELVLASVTGGLEPFRIAAAPDGTTLVLDRNNGNLRPASPVPPTYPSAVNVARLAAKSPETGSTRAGINGTIGATRDKLTFNVWSPNSLNVNDIVAIVDINPGAAKKETYPAKITSVDKLKVEIQCPANIANGAGTVQIPDPHFITYTTDFDRRGNDLIIPEETPVAATAQNIDVVVVQYKATVKVLQGALSPGTVKVPNRMQTKFDLTRYEALVEHELHHTWQAAKLGPWLLTIFPNWILELMAETDWLQDFNLPEQERQNIDDGWKTYFELSEFLTAGKLMNLVVGSTYAGLFWLVGLGIHGINQIGDIDLDFLDPFDFDFFPAQVPDAGQPDTIRVNSRNGQTLQLAKGDRIQVKGTDDTSTQFAFFNNRHLVTDELAGGLLKLDTSTLPTKEPGRTFKIAKVSSEHPLAGVDNRIMDGLGFDWISVLFDPYGELDIRTTPERGSFTDIMLRIGRYAFGTRSWSGLLILGYAFWDNLRRQWGICGKNPYLARMEKGASYASGDTYYPLGLLHSTGQASKMIRNKQLLVGDVAQFWHIPTGGNRRVYSVIVQGRQDAPGVHFRSIPCVMPFVDASNPAPHQEPNRGAMSKRDASVPANPAPIGDVLPDILFEKDPADPNRPFVPGKYFLPGNRGWIPATAQTERTCGMYVAFTKTNVGPAVISNDPHRITLVDRSAPNSKDGRLAFEAGRIQLIHDLKVNDVTVRLGGRKALEGSTFNLFPLEKAVLEITPAKARKYDFQLLKKSNGDIRQLAAPNTGIRTLKTAALANAEPMEIARVYRHNPGAGQGFGDSALNEFGLHLPDDISIPVRRLKVNIGLTVPVHDKADPDAATIPTFKPGQTAFMLVPVALRPPTAGNPNPNFKVSKYKAPPPANSRKPNLAFTIQAVHNSMLPTLKTMLRINNGKVISIKFSEADPPEEDYEIEVEIKVGTAANNAVLTATMDLEPHFRIVRQDGGLDYKVAPGADLDLETTNNIKVANIKADPAVGITFEADPADKTKFKIKVENTVAAGTIAKVLVDNKDDTKQKARRTFLIDP